LVPDFRTRSEVLRVQSTNVLDADPNPHAWLALIVIGEEYRTVFAGDACKPVTRTPSQLEAESAEVVSNAGIHVPDAKNRRGGTEAVFQ